MQTRRKADIVASYDRLAGERGHWIDKNRYYYDADRRYMRFLIPPDARVLEVGCGTGQLLDSLRPSVGVGVDMSPRQVAIAQSTYPHLEFIEGDIEDPATISAIDGPFDFIVLSDTIGELADVQATLTLLGSLATSETRFVLSYFSQLWRPVLTAAEKLRLRMPITDQNWLSLQDITHLATLSGLEPVRSERRLLIPRRLFGLGDLVNATLGILPGIRRLCLRHYVVCRPAPRPASDSRPSMSVIIPCRNEAGNIRPAISRIPDLGIDLEVVFVEGHSSDNTLDEIDAVITECQDRDIKVFVQSGKGKGDAVRLGFEKARGDLLLILDADLTVPPEQLGKFYSSLESGAAEYVQGTRLVYPMEQRAMRPLNFLGNKAFAMIFTWLLNQRVTDTLCGTKAMSRDWYKRLAANRDYFGDFDPFGDFDLIFGAAKLNMRMEEIPIQYAERVYGSTQISRFRDGVLLLKMTAVALRKMKVVR